MLEIFWRIKMRQPTKTKCPACKKSALYYINDGIWECKRCGFTEQDYFTAGSGPDKRVKTILPSQLATCCAICNKRVEPDVVYASVELPNGKDGLVCTHHQGIINLMPYGDDHLVRGLIVMMAEWGIREQMSPEHALQVLKEQQSCQAYQDYIDEGLKLDPYDEEVLDCYARDPELGSDSEDSDYCEDDYSYSGWGMEETE
jgi:hypothetical protein